MIIRRHRLIGFLVFNGDVQSTQSFLEADVLSSQFAEFVALLDRSVISIFGYEVAVAGRATSTTR